jgi:hypothetical protein
MIVTERQAKRSMWCPMADKVNGGLSPTTAVFPPAGHGLRTASMERFIPSSSG